MNTEESNKWNTLHNVKSSKQSADWLKNAYNPNINSDLRQETAIHLEQLSNVG